MTKQEFNKLLACVEDDLSVYEDGSTLRCSKCGSTCTAHYAARLDDEQFVRFDLCRGCYDLNTLRRMADLLGKEWLAAHPELVARWADRNPEPDEQDLEERW